MKSSVSSCKCQVKILCKNGASSTEVGQHPSLRHRCHDKSFTSAKSLSSPFRVFSRRQKCLSLHCRIHRITECILRETLARVRVGISPVSRILAPSIHPDIGIYHFHRLTFPPSFSSPSSQISCPSPSLTHLPANAPKTAIPAIPHQAAPTTPLSKPTP